MTCPEPLAAQPSLDLAAPADYSQRPALIAHVNRALQAAPHGIVWGGYLEQRKIYLESDHFYQEGAPRDVHLGIDLWASAGTEVFAPLDGTVHSFQDNAGFCNYGPTIVLEHRSEMGAFYTLYGHLARTSLKGLKVGEAISKGQAFCTLGKWEENGNWPPHLHFQVMKDLQGWQGDYPGACTLADRDSYAENCPDPFSLLEVP